MRIASAGGGKTVRATREQLQNLWDKNLSAEGFKGFLRPRKTDGSWAAPDMQVRGTWPDFFYEGDLWTYSFYAPQDVRRLIAMSGGDKTFVQRLDNIFLRGHFDVTNEPGFLMPVLYNWAGPARPHGRCDHSAAREGIHRRAQRHPG